MGRAPIKAAGFEPGVGQRQQKPAMTPPGQGDSFSTAADLLSFERRGGEQKSPECGEVHLGPERFGVP